MESGEYFWYYVQDGDIIGWHLSLGVALEVTLLSDISDMIFFEKMTLTLRERFWTIFTDFERYFVFDPSRPLK